MCFQIGVYTGALALVGVCWLLSEKQEFGAVWGGVLVVCRGVWETCLMHFGWLLTGKYNEQL